MSPITHYVHKVVLFCRLAVLLAKQVALLALFFSLYLKKILFEFQKYNKYTSKVKENSCPALLDP